ncbi:CGNR zinc finger domain-containing protein [Nocardiopsis lambiniae]|uniref:CGNR zinc finger domain-containing protein n=1 Tax=Nocardiopsis lambiniae TaxID=3075539 RepID=A0ABU2MC66_9ACTN|nr:CGNR zinc finger domain-containing protein [Nocardiopsis sp. DSM 44743]MDT0330285.1 CGNR zinc finger domain-containing protein [Nocardiopsis sp. DSM 44743]
MDGRLALELAGTIRHDGVGGIADDLEGVAGTARWLGEVADRLPPARHPRVDEELHAQVVTLRGAVRSLFARTVAPASPSPADTHLLPPTREALTLLNAAAARQAVVPRLRWEEGDLPTVEFTPGGGCPDTVAALARAAIAFLEGPDRDRLRSCPAPRCARYFVQAHGRQQWCGTSCGNRARAARHYRRHAPART